MMLLLTPLPYQSIEQPWANAHDTLFHPLIQVVEERMLILADTGFHAAEGDPSNLKLCRRGEWNTRMLVETVLCKQYLAMNLYWVIEPKKPEIAIFQILEC